MRSVRLIPAALGVATALALTATACGPTETPAADKPAGASSSAPATEGDGGDGAADLAGDLADKLKKHGVDIDKWKNGEWKNWDTSTWLREAEDFVNPVIENLWDPARMQSAQSPDPTIDVQAGVSGSDPVPRPVTAQREKTPYHRNAAPVGKIFFDSPKGSMVCSGTIVKDPRRPGKSNLVWTAGHCVHAGQRGGWYRNITFVPAFNDLGKSPAALRNARPHEVYPYGQYWADWAVTSGEWIQRGGTQQAWPYDYAILHVKPERGRKSLEETVGAALPVDFSAPAPARAGTVGAWGYPQAAPYNGVIMHKCLSRPSRVTTAPATPVMFRIGCTMTAGSSGGGWFRKLPNGTTALVSNTSIGPARGNGWLAGPQLGRGAKNAYDMVSKKFAR
ncbi:trypsin-like peptidase domain-containing protein [Streptomyces sp. CC208A]|uniref:trypsin-like serine peptidase n=1 Tax=Streptomyces sp. CC208A TaxID=3044573 RepID=UPI0024A82798|nr:trypsin-like peptidase domain-containing protein [Streptomyces sp. CC208A]